MSQYFWFSVQIEVKNKQGELALKTLSFATFKGRDCFCSFTNKICTTLISGYIKYLIY